RTRTRDRRKVVAEQDPPRRGVVVRPVVLRVCRRLAAVVERQGLRGDAGAVEPIRDDADGKSRDHEVEGLHGANYTRRVSPFGRLLAYVGRYRRAFVLGLICSIATTVITLVAPLVLQYAID